MSRPRMHEPNHKYYKTKPNHAHIKTFREVGEIIGVSASQCATTTDVIIKKILYACLSDSEIHSHYDGDFIKLLSQIHSQYGIETDMLARNFKQLQRKYPIINRYWSH